MVDATAIAGAVGGAGLGNFALVYGYERFDWTVTWIAVLTVVLLVRLAQFLGDRPAGRTLRR